jgi:hypothetical protein
MKRYGIAIKSLCEISAVLFGELVIEVAGEFDSFRLGVTCGLV